MGADRIKDLEVKLNTDADRRRYDVLLGITRVKGPYQWPIVLDYLCGDAGMYAYIARHLIPVSYVGVDTDRETIERCRTLHLEPDFYHLTSGDCDELPTVDYAICNALFLHSALPCLFSKAKVGLAFNVASAGIDWLHVVTQWVMENLTSRFILRNDYSESEFTIYAFHDNKE